MAGYRDRSTYDPYASPNYSRPLWPYNWVQWTGVGLLVLGLALYFPGLPLHLHLAIVGSFPQVLLKGSGRFVYLAFYAMLVGHDSAPFICRRRDCLHRDCCLKAPRD